MKFHEKSLEINITHELLNLADSWLWFLNDSPLLRYWRPAWRMPFMPVTRSTGAGLHINAEGTNDPTGAGGGGYDVRIKSGSGGHLLFIQYKKGDLENVSPGTGSLFATPPHDHYNFTINSVKSNQHFLLLDLENGIGSVQGNAVVYALPLINDMAELEANAGRLVRKTKFISPKDIDEQAAVNKVAITKNTTHNFRIGVDNIDRCEVNKDFFRFESDDLTPQVIADVIGLNFEKGLRNFFTAMFKHPEWKVYRERQVGIGITRAYYKYLRYLLHYFEVDPTQLPESLSNGVFRRFFLDFSSRNNAEFSNYQSAASDLRILEAIGKALLLFDPLFEQENIFKRDQETIIPVYQPGIFIPIQANEDFRVYIPGEYLPDEISDISFLKI